MKNFADYLLQNSEKNKKNIFINGKIKYFNLKNIISKINEAYFSNFKDKLIGISIDTSENFLLIYLSVIKSGNIAVLIEKSFSEKNYLDICNKFKIDYFISNKKFEDNNFINKNIILKKNLKYFENNELFIYKFKNSKNKIQNKNKNIAIVLFTSGSSGEKKGVMLTHNNLISNTKSILKVLPITRNDIVNLILPTSYSFGLSILNTHIKMGAKIFVHNSPFIGSIINEIKKHKCSSFYGVPSTYEILIKKTNFLNSKLESLKYIAQAGGNLNQDLKEKLIKKFRNRVYIMYGATEASPRLSFVPPKFLNNKINSIGRPIPGVKFKLIKRSNGYYELAAKGKNIMKGYLYDLALTRQKLKNNFFLTGDLAYKDKDNFFYITKRVDKIVKRFGYKVNLNYLEQIINKITGIKFSKLFFNSDEELILLVQAVKKQIKNVKKKIDLILEDKFASYEHPDKIFISEKEIISYSKKLSLQELYNEFLRVKNVKK